MADDVSGFKKPHEFMAVMSEKEYLPRLAADLAEAEVLLAQGQAIGHVLVILKPGSKTALIAYASPDSAKGVMLEALRQMYVKIGGG